MSNVGTGEIEDKPIQNYASCSLLTAYDEKFFNI